MKLRSESVSWTNVSEQLEEHTGTCRTLWSCFNRYRYYVSKDELPPRPNENAPWSAKEDAMLRKLREEGYHWKVIATCMKRTEFSCKHRMNRLGNPLHASREWTQNEDEHILRKVRLHIQLGERPSWIEIGKDIDRSADGVWSRYHGHLDPELSNFKRGDWTDEEDAHITKSVKAWPNDIPISWKSIGDAMSRLGNNVRNRYLNKLSKLARDAR